MSGAAAKKRQSQASGASRAETAEAAKSQKGELPEGWKWVTLDEAADVKAGNPAPQGEDKFMGGHMPFVRVKDMGKIGEKAWLYDVDDYVNEKGAEKLKLFRKGSVLFTKSGASTLLNQRAMLGQDSYVVSHIATAEPNTGVLSEWIYYWMKLVDFGTLAHGANMPSLPLSKIKSIALPLAPLSQQKQIVARIEELFSHIDAGIAALQKAKQLLKQYRQSVLQAAVTGELTKEWREANKDKLEPASKLLERILDERRKKWEELQLQKFKAKDRGKPELRIPKEKKREEYDVQKKKPLFKLPKAWGWARFEQLGQVMGGLTKNRKRDMLELKLPYLRVANVYADELRLTDVATIGVSESELKRSLLKKNDLLIVEGNGSPEQIGRVAIWDDSIPKCVHQNHIIKVRLEGEVSAAYLMYWLSSLRGRNSILGVASSTSGLYTLSISKVSGLTVPLPPVQEQLEICNQVSLKLESIESLRDQIDGHIDKSERSKYSLLVSLFSGKVGQKCEVGRK